ncbi:hypothetical protein B0H21DRAFT_685940 [Amylocystis lapponica]|nr:hypothetical protein B0H21DRAFT_685940 [Amylocystis lapponica]
MTGPWEIYAEQLFQRGHGHPLWDPQPTKHGEVLIGDVGYMRNGRFYRLFNATRSAEDEINRRYGVPAGFKPLVFEDYLLDRREGAIQADPLCSMSVKSMGVGAQAGIQGIGGGLQFECSEQQGAVLVIKDAAVREELHPSDTITDYMLDHHHTWYAFAKDRFGLALEKEDIIFVRGWAKTTEWAVAAFIQAGHAAQVTFNGQFGLGANASFFLSASRDVSMVWDHNSGPVRAISGRSSELLTSGTETGSDEPSVDQCIFLHYYKLKRRLGLFPRVMKAAAEPTFYTRRHPDGDHDGDTAEPTTSSLDAEYEIEQAPRGEQVSIPSHEASA